MKKNARQVRAFSPPHQLSRSLLSIKTTSITKTLISPASERAITVISSAWMEPSPLITRIAHLSTLWRLKTLNLANRMVDLHKRWFRVKIRIMEGWGPERRAARILESSTCRAMLRVSHNLNLSWDGTWHECAEQKNSNSRPDSFNSF